MRPRPRTAVRAPPGQSAEPSCLLRSSRLLTHAHRADTLSHTSNISELYQMHMTLRSGVPMSTSEYATSLAEPAAASILQGKGRAAGGTSVLTLSCPERPGIVQAVTSFLYDHGFDIVEHQQFDDRERGTLFLRTAFSS